MNQKKAKKLRKLLRNRGGENPGEARSLKRNFNKIPHFDKAGFLNLLDSITATTNSAKKIDENESKL